MTSQTLEISESGSDANIDVDVDQLNLEGVLMYLGSPDASLVDRAVHKLASILSDMQEGETSQQVVPVELHHELMSVCRRYNSWISHPTWPTWSIANRNHCSHIETNPTRYLSESRAHA